MLIPAHPCEKFALRMMPQSHHSPAQYHKDYFREKPTEETCTQVLGKDIKPSAGMRVKLTDAGKEYIRLFDAQHKTSLYDEGVGTVVGNGRAIYTGMCDVFWDSGNKPEIDNSYFVYNAGNDGLYHLALAEQPTWNVQKAETRGMTDEDRKKLDALSKIAQLGARPGTQNRR